MVQMLVKTSDLWPVLSSVQNVVSQLFFCCWISNKCHVSFLKQMFAFYLGIFQNMYLVIFTWVKVLNQRCNGVLFHTRICTFTFSLLPPHHPQPLASIITSSFSTTSFFSFTFCRSNDAKDLPERPVWNEIGRGREDGVFILLSKSHLLFPSQPGKEKRKNERE